MLRVATFNIENLDAGSDDRNPSLDVRAPVLRDALNRLNADIICLQEVHGQELPGHTSDNPKRNLAALDLVLAGTEYARYERVHTTTSEAMPFDKRNLIILSRYPIQKSNQHKNDYICKLQYRKVTADPEPAEAEYLMWERPILYAEIAHPQLGALNILNLHLKSRLATTIPGQKADKYSWATAAGWAEGYFLSSIKRVGQALETRILVDDIFDREAKAKILVCGDFNAEPGQIPVEAICGTVENTNNPDLQSRVLVPCSRTIPESVRFSHYHHGHGNLLDHILISQSLLPCLNRAEIHNENLHDESLPYTYDTKYPESDHAAFVAEFMVA